MPPGDEFQNSFDPVLQNLLDRFESDLALDEILINGTRGMVLHSRGTVEAVPSIFEDDLRMIEWLQDFAHGMGLRLDPLQPFVGGMVRGNAFRWHCILPPIATAGPLFSLRRHRFRKITLSDFSDPAGSIPAIAGALQRGSPLLVAGPTACGKTTFLHALLAEYCAHERVFIIESVQEIPASGPNWVRLVQREANIEGEGEVKLCRVISESLRMCPQRVVIGEIRGDEAVAYLSAQSTGHRGALATIHAGSVEGAVSRLFALAGTPLPAGHSTLPSSPGSPGSPISIGMEELMVVRLSQSAAAGRPQIAEARTPDWDLLLAKK